MQIKVKNYRATLTFSLFGELDENAAELVRKVMDEEIEAVEPCEVVIDFNGVSFMDSTGIGVLLGRYKKLSKRDVPIYVKNLSSHIDKIFTASGLYRILKKIS